MYKITIIWWTDWFGKWLANYIVDNFENNEITITGRNTEKGSEVSKELWCNFSTDNIESVKNADIVVISVPISITTTVIEQVAPHMKKWSLLADVTSIKKKPKEYMEKYAPEWVTVIPIHPMFWPFVKKIAGQVFVLTAEEEVHEDSRYQFLKNFLDSRWAQIVETSAQEHDRMMAIVQWLTHFVLFVLADSIRKLDIDVAFSQKFVSPVYKLLISTVARYMSQNPYLYADIQMNNDEILGVHEAFMESTNLFNSIVKRQDAKEFVYQAEQAAKHFGPSAKEGQQYTDKIIHLLGKQINYIKDNIGKEIFVENIYKKETIKVAVWWFDGKNIILEDGTKLDINEWIVTIN